MVVFSLGGSILIVASLLEVSDLAVSGTGSTEPGLAEFTAPVPDLDASRDVSSSFAAGLTCSVLDGSAGTGRPRLPCFCRLTGLLSVEACTGAWPSAG